MADDKVWLSSVGFDPIPEESDDSLPSIILMHGITSSKEKWKDVIRPLAEGTGLPVYAYDARNHGDSGWSSNFDYEHLMGDLLRYMESIMKSKAILVGHSMGGKIAMKVALNKPDIVDKLVLEDTSPRNLTPDCRQYAFKYIQLMKNALREIPRDVQNLKDAQKFMTSFIFENTPQEERSERHRKLDPAILPLKKDECGKFQWKTNLAVLEDAVINSFNVRNELQVPFEKPALFLYGTKSTYGVVEDKDLILNLFPKAVFRAVEGATHQIHVDYLEIFLNDVIHFIRNN